MITDLTIYVSLLVKHSPPTMPRLKSLVIDNLGDTWVGAEDLQKWTNLSHLSITALEIRNHFIPQRMVLPKTLTSLSLNNFRATGTRPLVLAFYYLPNLEHLRLRNVGDDIEPVAQNTPIISTKLRTLSIIHCPITPESVYRDIAVSCPDLESLELSYEKKSFFINHFREGVNLTNIRSNGLDNQWDSFVWGLTQTTTAVFLYEGLHDPGTDDDADLFAWGLRRVEYNGSASSIKRLEDCLTLYLSRRPKYEGETCWLLESFEDEVDGEDDEDNYW